MNSEVGCSKSFGDDYVPHEHHSIRENMAITNMNIKLLRKKIEDKGLARKLTKLNSEVNNELGVESVEMYRLVLFNLEK